MMELVTGLVIGLFVGTPIGFILSAVLHMNSEDDTDSKI